MCKRALISLFFLAAMACATASPGWTQEFPAGPPPPPGSDSQVLPLDHVLPKIRSRRPGRFYDAEGPFPDGNGGYDYRIKWLTPSGRVIWFDADAHSGRILGAPSGDWRDNPPGAFGPGGYESGPVPMQRFGGPFGPLPRGPEFGNRWRGEGHRHGQ